MASPVLRCTLKPGTCSAGRHLQPMFEAWAAVENLHLTPGTANGCAHTFVSFPNTFISLANYSHLAGPPYRRAQAGFDPRVFPGVVNDTVPVWAFRWSADDVRLGFLGSTPSCQAKQYLELLSCVSFRGDLGLADDDQFTFAFQVAP